MLQIIDVYHQYYLDNPNDPSVDVDGEFYTNAVYSSISDKGILIELDGMGMLLEIDSHSFMIVTSHHFLHLERVPMR